MRISKQKRQIRKLVQILFGRYDVPSIYAGDIAGCLECPLEMVEEELGLLYEEGVLEPVFELHCRLCGGVIATHESPRYLIGGLAAECPHCLNQSEYDSEDDLVRAWAVRKDEYDLDADGAAGCEKILSLVTA
jgi:hypothetical protein